MALSPYDNCPCGSGRKLKWCCQKLAKFAERAEQALEKGQAAGALQAIDEGLATEPKSLWLSTLKVRIFLSAHDHEAAEPLINAILADHPGYRPVLQLRLQHELIHAQLAEAIETLQELFDGTPSHEMEDPLAWMVFVGRALIQLEESFAALAHLRTVGKHESFAGDVQRDIANLERDRGTPPWLRDTYEFRFTAGTPAGERCANAIALARQGRWRRAAAILEGVVSEHPEHLDAWFNLGLCQGWLLRHEAAAESMERYARLEPDATRAVDALALAICFDRRESKQTVDLIEIRYPIRDRTQLIQRLKDHPRFQARQMENQSEPGEDRVKDAFYLLDKESRKDSPTVALDDVRTIVAVIFLANREVQLQFSQSVSEHAPESVFVQVSGDAIDPHGVRGVAGSIPISVERMNPMWGLPTGGTRESIHRIQTMLNEKTYLEIWPDTPFGWFGDRTPREVANELDMKRTLRAALLLNAYSCERQWLEIDFSQLQQQLGIEPEVPVQVDSIEVDKIPISRLRYVPVEELTTPQLAGLLKKAMRFELPIASERSAAALVARTGDRDQFDPVAAFKTLIETAHLRADAAAAYEWIAKARRFDAETGLAADRPTWEISEWETLYLFGDINEWATQLALKTMKFQSDRRASQEWASVLLQAGILRLVPHPNDPKQMVLDSRLLQELMARFAVPQDGRIDLTPVGGQPGKIWTPADEMPSGGSSIILPGQEAQAKARSKLVIPGS